MTGNKLNNHKESKEMENSFLDVAKLVSSQLARWKERSHRHGQLLQSLVDLTMRNPERAAEGFTTFELHTEVCAIINKPWGDPEAISKTVSTAWRSLEQLWESKKEGIKQRAQDDGLEGYPILKKERGGGGGHSSRYYLIYKTFIDDEYPEDIHSDEAIDGAVVRYYLDDIANAGVWSRWLVNRFHLDGWRKLLFLGVGSCFIILIMVTLWILVIALPQLETIGQFITFGLFGVVIFGFIWHFFGPFYEVVFFNTALAPDWLQPLKGTDDRILVFERKQPEASNQIYLAKYNGICPACGGEIVVGKGGSEFKGRLIGRCSNSAREHVYSFDHHLRVGTPLRNM